MWDIFISHASEDKDFVARPIAEALTTAGFEVWFDEYTLKLGDSLRRSIERGISESRYGLVILSPSFFRKEWPKRELDALNAIEISKGKIILPIWHNISYEDIIKFSPFLGDKLAVSTDDGLEKVIREIIKVISRNIVDNSQRFNKNTQLNIKFLESNFYNTDSIVCISATKSLLALGLRNGTVQLWDVKKRILVTTFLESDTYRINAIAFSSDENVMIIALEVLIRWKGLASTYEATTGLIKIININKQETIQEIEGSIKTTLPFLWGGKTSGILQENNSFKHLVFSPFGKYFAVGIDQVLTPLKDHFFLEYGESIKQENHYVVRLWSLTQNSWGSVTNTHEDRILATEFSKNGIFLASSSYDGNVKIWDIIRNETIIDIRIDTKPVRTLSFSPDSKYLAFGNDDSVLVVWDVTINSIYQITNIDSSQIYCVLFSPRNRVVAIGTRLGEIIIWDVDKNEKNTSFTAHQKSIQDIAFFDDGNLLVTASTEDGFKLWTVNNYEQ